MLGFDRNTEQEPQHSEKEPEVCIKEISQAQTYGTIRIPPPSQWAEIIGVRGSEHCDIHTPDYATTSNKRSRTSESPPSVTSSPKRMAREEVSTNNKDKRCSGSESSYNGDSVGELSE